VNEDNVYIRLAGKMGVPPPPIIKSVPGILKLLLTPEEAEMVYGLPATIEEFAEKFDLDKTAAGEKLDLFAKKGVVMSFIKEGVLKYFCVRSLGQLHDASNAGAFNKLYDPIPDGLMELWEEYRTEDLLSLFKMRGDAPGLRFRVIPSRSALKDESQLLPYEDTEAILKNAPAIAVVNCPCAMHDVSLGKSDKPLEVCLQLTEGSATYAETIGIGRRLTLEEGMAKLRLAEESGLVPTVMGGDELGFICHCDSQCCSNLRHIIHTDYYIAEKSRYQSDVDTETCTGCEACVEWCPFKAIEMKGGIAVVDHDRCYGCGICVVKCPVKGAVNLQLIRPKEHIPLVKMESLQV